MMKRITKNRLAAYRRSAAIAAGTIRKQREAIHFLLELKDSPTEGAFTYATIRRIDEIRKIAGV